MFFYLLVGSLFWLGAIINFNKTAYTNYINITFIFIFILIAGLRYQTGFDWLVYEYNLTHDLRIEYLLCRYKNGMLQTNMEPLFRVLLNIIEYFKGGLFHLNIIVASFNGYCIYQFLKKANANILFSLAIYFCWVYLPLQMGVMRSSLSLSFLMLAIIAIINERKYLSCMWIIVGLGFHYSLILFTPIFLQRFWQKIIVNGKILAIFLVLIYLSKIKLLDLFFHFASYCNISFLQDRFSVYNNMHPVTRSLTSLLVFCINIFSMVFFLDKSFLFKNKFDSMLLSSLILMVIAQAFFWQFPLIWNRLQYFAILSQAILFYKSLSTYNIKSQILLLCGVALLSFSVLFYQLANPFFTPFIPYQSYISYYFFHKEGDGLFRTIQFYRQFMQSHYRL